MIWKGWGAIIRDFYKMSTSDKNNRQQICKKNYFKAYFDIITTNFKIKLNFDFFN